MSTFNDPEFNTILVELESGLYRLRHLRYEIDDSHKCAALNDDLSHTAAAIAHQLEEDEITQLSAIAETAQNLIDTINKKQLENIAK